MLEQSVPKGPYTVERTHARTGFEELQPVVRTHVGAVHEGLYPMGETIHWSRGRA